MKALWNKAEVNAGYILLTASVLVGVAIALDGAPARTINGIAGLVWFLASALFLRITFRREDRFTVTAATVAIGLLLVVLVKPSDIAWATVGFVVGGALIALIAKRDVERAALLLPALWLPLHLLVAISRLIVRAIRDEPARVRTDPPPTAALVPLVMVVATYVGALWFVRMRERRNNAMAAKAR